MLARLDWARLATRPKGKGSVVVHAAMSSGKGTFSVPQIRNENGWWVSVATGHTPMSLQIADGKTDRYSPHELGPSGFREAFQAELTRLDPPRSMRLALDPPRLALPSHASHGDQAMGPRGAGLATCLAGLAVRGKLQALVDDLRAVVPQVRGLQPVETKIDRDAIETLHIDGQPIKRVRSETVPGWRLEFEHASNASLPASEMSEGTLLALGVLTAIHAGGADLLLLDDLDRGLHPTAQAELVGCLRKMLERRQKLQILATSHSPYLLDLFEPDEVRVMALDPQGHSVCKGLEDHPKAAQFKEFLKAGEMWSHVWERW